MAATAKHRELKPDLQATIIALREEIMVYFKGTCVERMAEGNVQRVPLARYMSRLPYQYMRLNLEAENPQILHIGNLPVATLRKHPDVITLHTKVLALTPSLQQVEKELRRFQRKFLAGIPLKENATLYLDKDVSMTLPTKVDDKSLFKSTIREPMAYANVPDDVYREAVQFFDTDILTTSTSTSGGYYTINVDDGTINTINLNENVPF